MKTVLAGMLLLALGTAVPGPAGIATTTSGQSAKSRPVASPGKRTAPVMMQYEFDGVPAAGEPLVVTMSFTAAKGDALRLEFNAATALGLDRRVLRQVPAGEPVAVTLIPQQDGRHYLSVMARLENKQMRVFQVPVQVGGAKTAALVKRTKAVAGPDGELVLVMPSTEK